MPATKTALVIIGDGAIASEAVITIEVLRRAQCNVTICSMNSSKNVRCSRDINITADAAIKDCYSNLNDAIVVVGGLQPGGVSMGADELSRSDMVKEALFKHMQIGYLVAAIGSGPEVLAAHGVGKGKRVTCEPEVRHKMRDYVYQDNKDVILDGTFLTAKGPSTSFKFALEIVAFLQGRGTADRVQRQMHVN